MEPFYQSYGISEFEARRILKSCKFVDRLKNTKIIRQKILDYYKYDTLDEYINNKCDILIKKDIEINGNLGSLKSFMCSSFTKLNNELIKNVIEDLLKSNVDNMDIINKGLTKLQQKYKCYYYSPNNRGYVTSKNSFNLALELKNKVK